MGMVFPLDALLYHWCHSTVVSTVHLICQVENWPHLHRMQYMLRFSVPGHPSLGKGNRSSQVVGQHISCHAWTAPANGIKEIWILAGKWHTEAWPCTRVEKMTLLVWLKFTQRLVHVDCQWTMWAIRYFVNISGVKERKVATSFSLHHGFSVLVNTFQVM